MLTDCICQNVSKRPRSTGTARRRMVHPIRRLGEHQFFGGNKTNTGLLYKPQTGMISCSLDRFVRRIRGYIAALIA